MFRLSLEQARSISMWETSSKRQNYPQINSVCIMVTYKIRDAWKEGGEAPARLGLGLGLYIGHKQARVCVQVINRYAAASVDTTKSPAGPVHASKNA